MSIDEQTENLENLIQVQRQILEFVKRLERIVLGHARDSDDLQHDIERRLDELEARGRPKQ